MTTIDECRKQYEELQASTPVPVERIIKVNPRLKVSKEKRKTISRTGSHKSRGSTGGGSKKQREQGDHGGHPSDSESDLEENRIRDNKSDLDMIGVDISNENDWDTDLENEDPQPVYDHSGRSLYLDACKNFGVVPISYFLRHMNDSHLSMKHHGLAGEGMRPIAISLVSNATINTLDLTDNWLGYDGGMAVCEMLKENCFITDLNLSDNNLNKCSEHLCQIIQKNDTLRRVTLTGNGFDDTAAVHLANLILTTSKLEYLNLSHNCLGEKAGLLLGPAISENLCLKELDLSWNHLRRKGAISVAAGVKSNVFMKKVNLSWNGFGFDASSALMDALKANSVLEELDLTNNRIATEGAVLIGKGITVNESLKVIRIGKNPMQSAGCWAIAAAILKNPNCILEAVDFSDITVNKDFVTLWKQVEEKFPQLKMSHGGTEMPLKPKQRVHPLIKLNAFINSRNIRLVEFFNQFDKDGTMNVSKAEFRQGLELLIKQTGIGLTPDEVDMLVAELDTAGTGTINYSELVRGHKDSDKTKRFSTYKTLRPMTS
ncbi:leucine-rich repeat-containing protein 74B-like isoform X2 [Physella acuta]|uniref:leucine-rich repeat-containing protein 74B-like isoform X2 n=1 Tax=Physella acuta TaxID=109671 RepID=UPI0027DE9F4E|nr:leucine-rich repeat-containing protein 74B-like isoform X2 [Physella acuta]